MPDNRATTDGEAPAASPAPVDWAELRKAAERAFMDPVAAHKAYNAVVDAGYCRRCWITSNYLEHSRMSEGVCPVCGSKPRHSVIIGGQRLLSVADMARLLLVSPRRVRRLIADGRIPQAVRVGTAWYVPDGSGWEHVERRSSGNPNWRKGTEEGGGAGGV